MDLLTLNENFLLALKIHCAECPVVKIAALAFCPEVLKYSGDSINTVTSGAVVVVMVAHPEMC